MRRPTNLIRVNKEIKEKLDKLKIHPNQSYGEVIQNSLEISGSKLVPVKKGSKAVDDVEQLNKEDNKKRAD